MRAIIASDLGAGVCVFLIVAASLHAARQIVRSSRKSSETIDAPVVALVADDGRRFWLEIGQDGGPTPAMLDAIREASRGSLG